MQINIENLFKNQYLQKAFLWISKARANYSPHDSIWYFRKNYHHNLTKIKAELYECNYRFEPVKKLAFAEKGKAPVWIWNAQDSYLLKALSLFLQDTLMLNISKKCTHVKGHGGIHGALATIHKTNLDEYKFVFKSDVKSYYESMSHKIVMNLFKKHIKCEKILDIIEKFLTHLEDDSGYLFPMKKGISKGCPLSPIIAALYLAELDFAMEKLPVIYIRYMDDWIVLSKTRWPLRNAIRITNQILQKLEMEKHPDKTYIGRTKNGFDFLGFHFSIKGMIDLALKTKEKITEKLCKLYEHPHNRGFIDNYIAGVTRWVRGVWDTVFEEDRFSDGLKSGKILLLDKKSNTAILTMFVNHQYHHGTVLLHGITKP